MLDRDIREIAQRYGFEAHVKELGEREFIETVVKKCAELRDSLEKLETDRTVSARYLDRSINSLTEQEIEDVLMREVARAFTAILVNNKLIEVVKEDRTNNWDNLRIRYKLRVLKPRTDQPSKSVTNGKDHQH